METAGRRPERLTLHQPMDTIDSSRRTRESLHLSSELAGDVFPPQSVVTAPTLASRSVTVRALPRPLDPVIAREPRGRPAAVAMAAVQPVVTGPGVYRPKINTYDGAEPLEEYLVQFELTAAAYGWTDAQKAVMLNGGNPAGMESPTPVAKELHGAEVSEIISDHQNPSSGHGVPSEDFVSPRGTSVIFGPHRVGT
ncbi:hypothetical protein DMENIID0001_124520 [Sergentomyia squamirostris]